MIPIQLQEGIQKLLNHIPLGELAKASQALSQGYRDQSPCLDDKLKYLAYLAVRMPATFAAVEDVMSKLPIQEFGSLLDLGAGPGTSFFASKAQRYFFVEKDPHFIELGKQLHADSSISWINGDFSYVKTFPEVDVSLFSYSLGECPPSFWDKLLDRVCKATKQFLIIIEPGTKEGFRAVASLREMLIQKGLYLLAPCPHAGRCPIADPDWCHFSTRLSRLHTHRMIKGGSLGFEDEKYSYLIFSKTSHPIGTKRIIRHPKIAKGLVTLTTCSSQGIQKETISKRAENYHEMKKKKWGSSF